MLPIKCRVFREYLATAVRSLSEIWKSENQILVMTSRNSNRFIGFHYPSTKKVIKRVLRNTSSVKSKEFIIIVCHIRVFQIGRSQNWQVTKRLTENSKLELFMKGKLTYCSYLNFFNFFLLAYYFIEYIHNNFEFVFLLKIRCEFCWQGF